MRDATWRLLHCTRSAYLSIDGWRPTCTVHLWTLIGRHCFDPWMDILTTDLYRNITDADATI